MSKVKIFTDSASDLPVGAEDQYGIGMFHFPINVDGKEYLERIDFTPDEWYQVLESQEKLPTHAQITPFQFEEAFTQAAQDGYTHLIYVSINAAGSATHQNAQSAAKTVMEAHPEVSITVIDSGTYTYAYGYGVVEAAKMAQRGETPQNIVAWLQDWMSHCVALAAPYTLAYAKKSGRVSCAAAFVGELLGLKPIIIFANGEPETIAKVRGEKAVIPYLVKECKNTIIPKTPYSIVCGSEHSQQQAALLAKALEKELGYPPVETVHIGACISINIGPDVIAVCYKHQ